MNPREMKEVEKHLERLPGLEKWLANIPTLSES